MTIRSACLKSKSTLFTKFHEDQMENTPYLAVNLQIGRYIYKGVILKSELISIIFKVDCIKDIDIFSTKFHEDICMYTKILSDSQYFQSRLSLEHQIFKTDCLINKVSLPINFHEYQEEN